MKSILMSYNDYTNYTSELCHTLKRMGDADFTKNILDFVDIDTLLNSGRKKQALYTVAMIDYISTLNHIPRNSKLEKYRHMKMDSLCFSTGIETYTRVVKKNDMKDKALKNAIHEFLIYNIVETSVRNVS